jgi:S-formylglutathione hydrolase FrmB
MIVRVLVVAASVLSLPAQTLRTDSAYSSALQRMKTFTVMLPQSYDTARHYPVLYLLHGWGGGHRDWSWKTRLKEYCQNREIFVVMPDANNSWYVNSSTNPQVRYEAYIVGELPALIATRYAADTSKQAIAGLSMGGYGALMLALKYPQKYAVAASFSGALTMPRDLVVREGWNKAAKGNNGDFTLPSLLEAFGKEQTTRDTNSVFTLAKRSSGLDSAGKARLPYFYLATGIQDPLIHIVPGNRELRDSLYSLHLRYEYHETPGKHSWEYWNEALKAFLPRLFDFTGWK